MTREHARRTASGYVAFAVLLLVSIAVGLWLYSAIEAQAAGSIGFAVLTGLVVLVLWGGFFMVNPNEARVLQLFGAYVGSAGWIINFQ